VDERRRQPRRRRRRAPAGEESEAWRCSSCTAASSRLRRQGRAIRRRSPSRPGSRSARRPGGADPKTTSGKLQRYLLARAFESGEFAPVLARLSAPARAGGPAATAAATGSTLAGCKRSPTCCTGPTDRTGENLLEINLNSLTLARLHEAIDREFPQRIEVSDLFEHSTLADLARFLDDS
jgi:hypothetical protein